MINGPFVVTSCPVFTAGGKHPPPEAADEHGLSGHDGKITGDDQGFSLDFSIPREQEWQSPGSGFPPEGWKGIYGQWR